ncbi:MAG: PhoH family protein [Proteobacteria bacterium]|nr:PhoH family protein [Pseudomonadota bacterium]MCP4920676.1 PhoH family protein [Pseudomonadota bacterium]
MTQPETTSQTARRELVLEFEHGQQLRELAGEFGANLKQVGRDFGVRVSQRGTTITIRGDDGSVDIAADVLNQLYLLVGTGLTLSVPLVEQSCRMVRLDPSTNLAKTFTDVVFVGKKRSIFPRSANQAVYVDTMRKNDLVFGLGPAGTGKTYLAVAMAVAALANNEVQRIILCRPAVEAGEKLGFLPGDLVQKVNPYLRPLYDGLHDMLGYERVVRLMERGVIEVAPLAFMRGRTLSEAFVILDEAQNTTREQMKMFLTRLGVGSRAVVTGDLSQIDLPENTPSGLDEASRILRRIERIGFTEFTAEDVVRHGLVSAIVRAYDEARNADAHRGEAT